jgi:hypothetical protein
MVIIIRQQTVGHIFSDITTERQTENHRGFRAYYLVRNMESVNFGIVGLLYVDSRIQSIL